MLTCMDARIDVFRLLGLSDGDAHVLRNAGGLATDDALRSLAVSQRKLGTREVMVVQHTGCAMTTFDGEQFRAEVWSETGVEPAWRSTGAFGDVQQNVRDTVARLRAEPALPHRDLVRGFVYDVTSGALTEVGEEPDRREVRSGDACTRTVVLSADERIVHYR
ncbi:MAG: carbonic anhydrase [Quadrisphaera sp.]